MEEIKMSDGTGNAGNAGADGGQGNAGNEGNVFMTFATKEDYQKHLDSTLGKRFAEINTDANAKAEAKFKTDMDALKAQIQELQAGKGAGKGKGEGGEDLTALKARLAAMEQTVKTSQERERRASLNAIAAELNAVNAEQVTALVSSALKRNEDGSVSVLNAEGQVRYNGEGKPMTVREYVKEFLESNPHLVKASGQPGGGSPGARMGSGADKAALLNLPPIERLKAARAAGIK